ncbi:MAG TPA: HAD-IC family P-type ATPase [Candidatus Baltobacteraceae bacterium]|nr:HAD-IC family P-type ATPase [Candidatus Baltobacteraceae bacterium]
MTSAGLTQAEAAKRLAADGPNTVPGAREHPLRAFAGTFWAPVPWLLEATAILQLILHDYAQGAIVVALLLFNALLGYFQSSRAAATLTALKSRLALNAVVRRDGAWATVPASSLVRGDVMKLSAGAVVAADAHLIDGDVLLDQSMLTGESVPIEAGPGADTYAGALVRRGESTAEVTATGERTKFGRTAELVRGAHVVSSQQKAVLGVVRNIAAFNAVVIVALFAYALALGLSTVEIISLILTAVLASIPVALPATFTLAAAIGARRLAQQGVLPTRLSAVDEAASMDILCSDKTGTLTLNELTVTEVHPVAGFDEAHVLGLAALASSDGGNDPVDRAIRSAAAEHRASDLPRLRTFVPFDSKTKLSEASVTESGGTEQDIVKGAFATIANLAAPPADAATSAHQLEQSGYRVLAVAVGPKDGLRFVGLIALSDPPRPDSAALIAQLKTLGVRTIMVTGDAATTATIVAGNVGLNGAVCSASPLPDDLAPERFAAYAGVTPEEKFRLVQAFQKAGNVIGMCGDGANDAPALRQAQMGIAVATATDVAKSAAGIVLTTSGLGGIVAAVTEGRTTFARVLSYTLNMILKKIVVASLLVVGLLMTGHAVLTPMMMVVLMIVGDFLAMSLTTDNVIPSQRPNVWHINNLTIAGASIALCLLIFCSAILGYGLLILHLSVPALQTLAFVTLAFGTQTTIYAIRDRRHMRSLLPSRWLIASSIANVAICGLLAALGILMAPLVWAVIGEALAAAIVFGIALDLIKIPLFRRLRLS